MDWWGSGAGMGESDLTDAEAGGLGLTENTALYDLRKRQLQGFYKKYDITKIGAVDNILRNYRFKGEAHCNYTITH